MLTQRARIVPRMRSLPASLSSLPRGEIDKDSKHGKNYRIQGNRRRESHPLGGSGQSANRRRLRTFRKCVSTGRGVFAANGQKGCGRNSERVSLSHSLVKTNRVEIPFSEKSTLCYKGPQLLSGSQFGGDSRNLFPTIPAATDRVPVGIPQGERANCLAYRA